jgi:hypothetical protein
MGNILIKWDGKSINHSQKVLELPICWAHTVQLNICKKNYFWW